MSVAPFPVTPDRKRGALRATISRKALALTSVKTVKRPKVRPGDARTTTALDTWQFALFQWSSGNKTIPGACLFRISNARTGQMISDHQHL